MESILLHYNRFLGVYYNKLMIIISTHGKAFPKTDPWIFPTTSTFALHVDFLISFANYIQQIRTQTLSHFSMNKNAPTQKRIQVSLR